MASWYRLHPATESPATVMDSSRPIGWTAPGETHPGGVAVCGTLAALASYVRAYDMSVDEDDTLMEIDGTDARRGHDATDAFVIATGHRVIGTGGDFLRAAAAARLADAIDESWEIEDVEDEADDDEQAAEALAIVRGGGSDLARAIWLGR